MGEQRARPMVFQREKCNMAVMRILIDGHTFEARCNDDAETVAKSMASIVSDMRNYRVGLIDGSFLVLGQKQLERAVFLFVPDSVSAEGKT